MREISRQRAVGGDGAIDQVRGRKSTAPGRSGRGAVVFTVWAAAAAICVSSPHGPGRTSGHILRHGCGCKPGPLRIRGAAWLRAAWPPESELLRAPAILIFGCRSVRHADRAGGGIRSGTRSSLSTTGGEEAEGSVTARRAIGASLRQQRRLPGYDGPTANLRAS